MTATNPSVEFKSLGQSKSAKTPKKDVPVNVALRLENIEISNDKPGFFVGFDALTNEPVRVRMMSVDEGVAVNLRAGGNADEVKAKLNKQYVGHDAAHRPRPAEINDPAQKVHCQTGGLLIFTRCLKNEDGSYRAHWVETLEKTPGSGCEKNMVHVAIDKVFDKADKKTVIGTNVVADVAYTDKAVMLNQENTLGTLQAAFANKDGDVKRRPFVTLRLIDANTGAVVLTPARANAKYLETVRMDHDTGVEHTNYDADTAENSISRLLSQEAGKGENALIVRGAMWALTGQAGEPDLADITDDAVKSDVHQIIAAIRSGAVVVEAIPGERLSAGPATRASILKASGANPNNPINWYTKRNANGFATERRFADTFVTTALGKDGYRYFSKAVMVDCYPKPLPLEQIATVNDHKGVADASQKRAADQGAGIDEKVEPFNPGSLDSIPTDQVDAKLAASAAAIDGLEM